MFNRFERFRLAPVKNHATMGGRTKYLIIKITHAVIKAQRRFDFTKLKSFSI